MPPQEEDRSLAVAFAAHEGWAFGEAFQRYAALLYSTAYNVLGDPDEAQDCVADAVAKLWRSPRAYSASRGSLRSFLVVCIRNEAISRRRREARAVRVVERVAAMPVEHDHLQTTDPIERDRVRDALRTLPPAQRVALELAYYEEKTHREIAAELQEPLGTVKSRIKHGLRKIGSMLAAPASLESGRA